MTEVYKLGEIELPQISTVQRIRFGILCAKEVCSEPAWIVWADKWLSGQDRTKEAARVVAAETMTLAAEMAARAAWTTEASVAAAWADGAAEAAVKAGFGPLDLIALAQEAIKGET